MASRKAKEKKARNPKSIEQRALGEMKKYLVITLYLWVLFALFATYKRVLLQENGISLWNQGYAIVNALIFGKVVLIGQFLNLGNNLRRHALAWAVLGKCVLFTALLMLFHVSEEAIRAWFEGQPLVSAIQSFGGGTWLGLVNYASILYVALLPLLAFQEVSDAIGSDKLWKLLFTPARPENERA